MAELAVENLSLRFGGLTVLDGISFAVEPGQLFALIGPNGAGKTSALNCISGIYRGNGVIKLRDTVISGRALIRTRIRWPSPRLMYSLRPSASGISPAEYRLFRTGSSGGGRNGGLHCPPCVWPASTQPR